MTIDEAAAEVIASLVCSVGDLSCEDYCPFFADGRENCSLRGLLDYDTGDAIKALREHFGI